MRGDTAAKRRERLAVHTEANDLPSDRARGSRRVHDCSISTSRSLGRSNRRAGPAPRSIAIKVDAYAWPKILSQRFRCLLAGPRIPSLDHGPTNTPTSTVAPQLYASSTTGFE